jgi:hypothetical protein
MADDEPLDRLRRPAVLLDRENEAPRSSIHPVR